MKVIPPITAAAVTILEAMLTSSTIPEAEAPTYAGGTSYAAGAYAGPAPVAGQAQAVYISLQSGNIGHAQNDSLWWKFVGYVYPAYDSGTTYAAGNVVTDLTNHLLYESLVAGNLDQALTDGTKWLLLGPTNRWAMFDIQRNTQSVQDGSFTIVITPGQRCNALGLAGIVGNSYSLTVSSVSGGGAVYSKSGTLNNRQTLGWYDYFFGEFSTQESLVFFDIPPFMDAVYTLTITATSGNVGLGAFVLGSAVDLGDTQWTAESDVMNFSTISRDSFGNATLVARRNVPKTNQVVICPKSRVNKVRALRDELNAIPAFWCGVDDGSDGYFDSLSIVGVYKKFSIRVDTAAEAEINLELEEI